MSKQEMIAALKARCQARIESARQTVERIEKRGMRFYSQLGEARMEEVTDEVLAQARDSIDRNQGFLELYDEA